MFASTVTSVWTLRKITLGNMQLLMNLFHAKSDVWELKSFVWCNSLCLERCLSSSKSNRRQVTSGGVQTVFWNVCKLAKELATWTFLNVLEKCVRVWTVEMQVIHKMSFSDGDWWTQPVYSQVWGVRRVITANIRWTFHQRTVPCECESRVFEWLLMWNV